MEQSQVYFLNLINETHLSHSVARFLMPFFEELQVYIQLVLDQCMTTVHEDSENVLNFLKSFFHRRNSLWQVCAPQHVLDASKISSEKIETVFHLQWDWLCRELDTLTTLTNISRSSHLENIIAGISDLFPLQSKKKTSNPLWQGVAYKVLI